MNVTRFILSDDLTGAAGVASMVGESVAVTVSLQHYEASLAAEFPCIVFNLDVRERSEKEARRRAAEALSLAGGSWVALRIDSALRGAVKGLVREVCNKGKVLVTDTIPEYGRITRDGKTMLGGSVKDLREKLRPVQEELEDGWLVAADSASKSDLEELAGRCIAEGRIPVDPGPLVSLVARAGLEGLGGREESGVTRSGVRHVAFVIGTTDDMTMRQLRYMEEQGYPLKRPVPRERAPVSIFTFSFDQEWRSVDDAFLQSLRGYEALVLSGGATAGFVLERSGCKCIVSGEQIQPLLSTGRVRGGLFDGKMVVLKGGFIGDEKTYKTILEWLTRK